MIDILIQFLPVIFVQWSVFTFTRFMSFMLGGRYYTKEKYLISMIPIFGIFYLLFGVFKIVLQKD